VLDVNSVSSEDYEAQPDPVATDPRAAVVRAMVRGHLARKHQVRHSPSTPTPKSATSSPSNLSPALMHRRVPVIPTTAASPSPLANGKGNSSVEKEKEKEKGKQQQQHLQKQRQRTEVMAQLVRQSQSPKNSPSSFTLPGDKALEMERQRIKQQLLAQIPSPSRKGGNSDKGSPTDGDGVEDDGSGSTLRRKTSYSSERLMRHVSALSISSSSSRAASLQEGSGTPSDSSKYSSIVKKKASGEKTSIKKTLSFRLPPLEEEGEDGRSRTNPLDRRMKIVGRSKEI